MIEGYLFLNDGTSKEFEKTQDFCAHKNDEELLDSLNKLVDTEHINGFLMLMDRKG